MAYRTTFASTRSTTSSKMDIDTKNKLMLENVKVLVNFIEMYQVAPFYETSTAAKTGLKDDTTRILALAKGACQDPSSLQTSDLDEIDAAKACLVKGRNGTFYTGFTIFPTGTFIVESMQAKVAQFRQDQLLQKELAGAVDLANAIVIKKEMIMKDKGDGDFEISVPNASKFGEMVTKLHAFMDGASSNLRETQPCKEMCQTINVRVEELRHAFLEAVVQKHEFHFKDLGGLLTLTSKPEGLSDEQTALCCQHLNKLLVFQAFPKFQVSKLLGKQIGTEVEAAIASIISLGKLVLAALPKLVRMSSASGVTNANESLFINEMIINLYSALHTKGTTDAIEQLAPVLTEGVQSIKGSITSAFTAWVCKTAGTFPSFLGALLSADIDLATTLKQEIVGSVDSDVDDVIDWLGVYNGFVRFGQNVKKEVQVQMQGEKKSVEINMAFLCLAGALLQVSQCCLFLADAANKVHGMAPFKDLMNTEFSQKSSSTMKSVALQSVLPYFARITKATTSLRTMLEKIEEEVEFLDNIKDFYTKLFSKVRATLQMCLENMFGEIDSMQSGFDDIFAEIKKKHVLLEVFQGDKLNETTVSTLINDEKVKLFLFMGGKAGSCCDGINSFVNEMNALPKESVISSTLGNMLVSLTKNLETFASSKNAKQMPQTERLTLSNVSWLQGSLTLAQVMTRKLAPGETRLGLVGRALKLLDSKQMGCEAALKQKASQLQEGK